MYSDELRWRDIKLPNSLTQNGLTLGEGILSELKGSGKLWPSIWVAESDESKGIYFGRLRFSYPSGSSFKLPNEGYYRCSYRIVIWTGVVSDYEGGVTLEAFFGNPEDGIPGGTNIIPSLSADYSDFYYLYAYQRLDV